MDNKLQTTGSNLPGQTLTPQAQSQKFLQDLAALEKGEAGAKIAVVSRASELMPSGKPAFTEMRKYPMIAQLIKEHGTPVMISAVFVLIRDFCASLNVVRNMSDDQMIEAAAMLIDECDNFRMEDYLMMFTLAKRGQLVKILDRVDIQVIGQMLDAYWERRNAAGNKAQEESLKPPPVQIPAGAKMADPAKVSAFMLGFADDLKKKMEEEPEDDSEQQEIRRQQMNMRRRAMFEGKEAEDIDHEDIPTPEKVEQP